MTQLGQQESQHNRLTTLCKKQDIQRAYQFLLTRAKANPILQQRINTIIGNNERLLHGNEFESNNQSKDRQQQNLSINTNIIQESQRRIQVQQCLIVDFISIDQKQLLNGIIQNIVLFLQLEIMHFQKNKVVPQFQQSNNGLASENNRQKSTCRICLDEDYDLISPCQCTGSMQYVHQKCMKSWIKAQFRKDKTLIRACQICLQKIGMEVQSEYKWDPSDCYEKSESISSCALTILFVCGVGLVIGSIVLAYSKDIFLFERAKIGILCGIVFLGLCTVGVGIYIFIVLMTKVQYKVLRIYDRKKRKFFPQTIAISSRNSVRSSSQN